MSEEKKTDKRKIVLRYILLAAAILLISAAAVLTVFAANNWFRADVAANTDDNTTDKTDDKTNDDDSDDDDSDTSSDDDTPTVVDTSWITPVASADVINSYDFIQDVTLMNSWHLHEGIDFAAEAGEDVLCCYDGVIEEIVTGDELNGNYVVVSHSDGVKSIYTYLDIDENLAEGASVKRGEKLGVVSEATGAECALTAHLHFAVEQNGELKDPEDFLEVSSK